MSQGVAPDPTYFLPIYNLSRKLSDTLLNSQNIGDLTQKRKSSLHASCLSSDNGNVFICFPFKAFAPGLLAGPGATVKDNQF